MDYRSLLAIPLATLALSASSAEALRMPSGWLGGHSFGWPANRLYAYGVAPESEQQPQRALTVQAIGKRQASDLGAISQTLMGYAGQRVRFSAQVKATGVDTWAGLVVREGYLPLFLLAVDPDEAAPSTEVGTAACPDWCRVSVVADIPAGSQGSATVGLALLGNGQVWARDFKVEVVGIDVPLTQHGFAAAQTEALRAQLRQSLQARAVRATPPQNLGLQ
ncbi:MAG: hypothetical protein JNL93_11415 [Pelomonas sp.]|nr:hypothetical protein [Roseateles sp.]